MDISDENKSIIILLCHFLENLIVYINQLLIDHLSGLVLDGRMVNSTQHGFHFSLKLALHGLLHRSKLIEDVKWVIEGITEFCSISDGVIVGLTCLVVGQDLICIVDIKEASVGNRQLAPMWVPFIGQSVICISDLYLG